MGRRRKEEELLCKCPKCNLDHYRSQRNKIVPKEGSEKPGTLKIYVCPKCGAKNYIVL